MLISNDTDVVQDEDEEDDDEDDEEEDDEDDLIFKGVRLRPLSGAPRLVEDRGLPAATKAQNRKCTFKCTLKPPSTSRRG